MLRIMSMSYNEARECSGCSLRDEKQVSTHILSFQIAGHLLKQHQGSWNITEKELILKLKGFTNPVAIDIMSGTITYGTVTMPFYSRYSPEKGVKVLVDEICEDLAIPCRDDSDSNNSNFLFNAFVKLVEIFHARCDLRIIPSKTEGEWEIRLSQDGPSGWIGEDNIAENRFGEKIDISQWKNIRPEKLATYIFGFNRFCKHFQCPMK
ncbi:MAG: hypothetical protein APF84_17020 [Gracilibacter sp. BRH_c7a]|nr:MAG: hypothetical protein APF84_17020 [Gracilibacter sp. BRH_c7a]